MNIVEEHGWDAIANLIPALGRDFTASISAPDDGKSYSCSIVLTYLTDIGEAMTKIIADQINDEMIRILTSQIKDEKLRAVTVGSLAASKVADVVVIDGRNRTDETPAEEPKEPAQEESPRKEPETQSEDIKVADFHWANVFKAYMPNPDVETFYTWIRRLLTIEINRRLVADKVPARSLPDTFDEDWMNGVSLAVTAPVNVGYDALITPSGFSNLSDRLYAALMSKLNNDMFYDGTVKVDVIHDVKMIQDVTTWTPTEPTGFVNAYVMYMTNNQNKHNNGE